MLVTFNPNLTNNKYANRSCNTKQDLAFKINIDTNEASTSISAAKKLCFYFLNMKNPRSERDLELLQSSANQAQGRIQAWLEAAVKAYHGELTELP